MKDLGPAMHDITLVLTDMDGTIVQEDRHEVSEKVRESIVAAEKKGIKVIPVTGRPYEMAKNVMTILGFDGLAVLDGGATIRKVTSGEIVWSKWLDAATLKQVVGTVLPYTKNFIDYFPGFVEIEPSEADVTAIDWAAPYVFLELSNEDVSTVEALLTAIPEIVTFCHPRQSRTGLTGMAINHSQADKYHGIEALRTLLGIDRKHTMGIGDSSNDVPLFKNAGLKIAMGNANDKLKAEADYIVGPVDQDGFAEAMERFVLRSEKP